MIMFRLISKILPTTILIPDRTTGLSLLTFALCIAWHPAAFSQTSPRAQAGSTTAEASSPTTDRNVADATTAQTLKSPGAVVNQLPSDRAESETVLNIDMFQNWDERKAQFRESRGLDFSLDYITLGALATDSLNNTGTASGVARFYGQWDLVNRGDPNEGSFIFKVESRHKYSPDAPAFFASDLGYAGTNYLVYTDTTWRVTHLEWQQHFCDGEWVWYAGFLDTTDFVDVYALGSPWESFTNLAMSSGSAMIDLPNGTLGAVLGGFLTERVYVAGSISDINGDPTQISFDSFFNQSEYISTLEIGLTSSKEKLFLDNAHATFWHVDPRQQAGTAEQWGVTTNFSKVVKENWLPFVRGGWSTSGGGSFLQTSVSAGIGYQRDPSKNVTAVGVNWGKPNEDTYGQELNSQWTVEAFQLLQLTKELQVTPSVQLIWDPALNPDTNFQAAFGLRMRLVF